MEEDKFSNNQYSIQGGDNGVLRIRLNPGQSLYVDESSIACCNGKVTKIDISHSFFSKQKVSTLLKHKFVNDSAEPAILTVTKNNGRIFAFNTSLVPKLRLKASYLLAHTDAISLKKIL